MFTFFYFINYQRRSSYLITKVLRHSPLFFQRIIIQVQFIQILIMNDPILLFAQVITQSSININQRIGLAYGTQIARSNHIRQLSLYHFTPQRYSIQLTGIQMKSISQNLYNGWIFWIEKPIMLCIRRLPFPLDRSRPTFCLKIEKRQILPIRLLKVIINQLATFIFQRNKKKLVSDPIYINQRRENIFFSCTPY